MGFEAEEQEVNKLLLEMDPISLQQLDGVQLLNRVDSKFVFHFKHFPDILKELQPHYNVLDIDGRRMFNYESLYFDTNDYLLYRFHHSGRPNRVKVRYRRYMDSGLTFFEVKYKVNGLRTDKKRFRESTIFDTLREREKELIYHKYLNNDDLEKKLWIRFKRITLAGKDLPERATLDLNICFDNFSKEEGFPQLVIAEVKQDKSSVFSPMIQAFKKRHFEQIGFSKYTTGVALLEPIKHNAFKPNLIKIKKILHGNT